jgi:hypothetical protein
MPVLFQLSKVSLPIKDAIEAKKALLLVGNPKTAKYEGSAAKIAHIDTGEALFLGSNDTQYSYAASTGTSSCLQIYFYNSSHEKCLIHYNSDFSINWEELFRHFTNKKINFCLIGATTIPGQVKSERNLDSFFDSLFAYVNKHDLELTLTHQQVLSHNKNNRINLFSPTTPIAKLSNIAFDPNGNIYDVTAIRMSLNDFPLAPDLRKARKHEGEHRAWLSRQFQQETPKPEILLMKPESRLADILQNTVFHKVVIDFATLLKETNKITAYCEFMTQKLFQVSKPNDRPEAAQYFQSLKLFFSNLLQYAQDNLKDLQTTLAKHPHGPFNPVILSYQQDYSDQIETLMRSMPFNETVAKLAK